MLLNRCLSQLQVFWSVTWFSCQTSSLSENMGMGKQGIEESNVLIECIDVHKSFGDKQILKGVSFKVK